MIAVTLLLAQVIQVQAGASTLLNADGGTVTLFTPNTTSAGGVGVSDGHLVASLSTRFGWKGWNLYAGDRQIFLTTGAAGLAESSRGLAVERAGAVYQVGLFVGACGRVRSVPYFFGTTARDYCAGYFFSRRVGALELGSFGVLRNGKKTSAGSLTWHRGPLRLAASGGKLEDAWLANGSADLRWKHLGINATRATYLVPTRTDLTSEGIGTQFGGFDFYGSAFQSHFARGEALGAGIRIAWLQLRGNEFWSSSGHTTTANATENITRRISLSQFATRSAGRNAFNLGGSFRSNLLTASLAWQEYFAPGVGFRTLPTASLSLQLPRSITLNLQLLGSRWSAWGGAYVGAANPSAPAQPWRRPKLTEYVP